MPNNHSSFNTYENTSESSQHENKSKSTSSSEIYPKKWTLPENILYARYLKIHTSQMTNYKKKKCGKYGKMANFIGSKTQNQCRSHHQKMMLTFHSIQNIIKHVAELKRGKEVLTVDQSDQKNSKGETIRDERQKIQKIQKIEELTIEKQSQQTQNEGKQQEIKCTKSFTKDFPIYQEQSFFHENLYVSNDIFDVLDINSAQKYSKYFSC